MKKISQQVRNRLSITKTYAEAFMAENYVFGQLKHL